VELYLKVRRAHFHDGLSDRAIARGFGIIRDSVVKMLTYSEPPGYRRTAPIKRPKLDGFTDQINIWLSEDKTRAEALVVIDLFKEKYGVKFGKAVSCQTKSQDEFLAFYDFPAEHWIHLRTSNPPSRACEHALPGNNRKRVCHRPSQNGQNQGGPVAKDRKIDGVYAHSSGIQKMVAVERQKPVAKTHRRYQVHRRCRNDRH